MKVKSLAPIILFLLVGGGCKTGAPPTKIDKSPEKQQGRAEIIRDLTQRGLFAKIEESRAGTVLLEMEPESEREKKS